MDVYKCIKGVYLELFFTDSIGNQPDLETAATEAVRNCGGLPLTYLLCDLGKLLDFSDPK